VGGAAGAPVSRLANSEQERGEAIGEADDDDGEINGEGEDREQREGGRKQAGRAVQVEAECSRAEEKAEGAREVVWMAPTQRGGSRW
jgi:hypothetical protein